MKYKAKSVVVSRKPNHDDEETWSAFIGLFNENNPHLKAKIPFKIIEIPLVEKVRVKELRNISFYLQGNDLVINNLKEINIDTKDKIVTLTGKQELP
ncbi:MAG: hypothetical protein AABW48_01585 [Nanoarchaeota archaeon]